MSDMDAIRARLREAHPSDDCYACRNGIDCDIRALLAENERLHETYSAEYRMRLDHEKGTLRAEVARLTAEVAEQVKYREIERQQRDSQFERVERLAAEVEQWNKWSISNAHDLFRLRTRAEQAEAERDHNQSELIARNKRVDELLAALAAANERIADCSAGVQHCGLRRPEKEEPCSPPKP